MEKRFLEKKLVIRCHYKREFAPKYTCPDGCCEGGGYWYEGYGVELVERGTSGGIRWLTRELARAETIECRELFKKAGYAVRIEKVGTWS